jgi:rhodanese-related sulfurtransferase
MDINVCWALPSVLTNEQQIQPDYTLSYAIISPEDAQELISTKPDLIIADVRGCDCDFDEEHIPDAIWQVNPTLLYNTTNDILIYCQDGLSSVTFCKDLLNHTYGAIYVLEGGINAWKNAGYRVTEL